MEEFDPVKARVKALKTILADIYISLGEIIQEKNLSSATTQTEVDSLVEEEILRAAVAIVEEKLKASETC